MRSFGASCLMSVANPNEIYHFIQVIKQGVKDKEISKKQIDDSVRKILEAKGFTVKD